MLPRLSHFLARGFIRVKQTFATIRPIGERTLRKSSDELDHGTFKRDRFGPGKTFQNFGLWHGQDAARQHLQDDAILMGSVAPCVAFVRKPALPAAHPDIKRGDAVRSKEDVDINICYRRLSHLSGLWQLIRGSRRSEGQRGPCYSAMAPNRVAIAISGRL